MRLAITVLLSVLLSAGCDGDDGVDAGPGGGDAGPGGDAGAPRDAGPGEGDAGPGSADAGPFDTGSCAAAPATIEPACPFTPCGGALEGAWCYTGVCIAQADLFGGFAGCMASDVDWSGVTGTVTGRALFDATAVQRVATTELSGTLGIPPSCVPIPGQCAGTVAAAINSAIAPDGSATCREGTAGGCDCDVTLTFGVETSDTYTTSGDQLMVDGRTFDYCVGGDGSLSVKETGGTVEEPALQTLAPE